VAINMMDDPRHARIRRLVTGGLTPRRVAKLEADLRHRTRSLLAEIEDGADYDFLVGPATELPLQVICSLLGIPEDQRHHLWDAVDSGSDIPTGDAEYGTPEERRPAKTQKYEYAHSLMAAKRAHPTDDMLSVVIHATLSDIEPSTMSDTETYCFLRNIFGAGSETTRTAIAAGLLALTEHPEQFHALRSDPSLLPSAIEELLRWTTPSRRSGARSPARQCSVVSTSRPATRCCSGRAPRTATSWSSTGRWISTYGAIPTRISRSARASTSASAPISPGWRCG